ncbi:MAG: type VI secretion system tube protein Hcp [Methylococcaceae bacterium]|nr:type VI secretion system tube protein Hcp [Methylococcaceae bacterium]
MAVDMFIKIEGIAGESKDAAHAGEIDVLAWNWGMTQSGSFHVGGGGGAGKVSVNNLSLSKYVDKASSNLMLFCSNGDHIPSATLYVRKAGKVPLEYIIIEMKKVMVVAVSTGGSGGEDRLIENISLNFAHVKVDYQQQKDDGSKEGGPVTYLWDIEANKSQ